jgi:hypothetical protein
MLGTVSVDGMASLSIPAAIRRQQRPPRRHVRVLPCMCVWAAFESHTGHHSTCNMYSSVSLLEKEQRLALRISNW